MRLIGLNRFHGHLTAGRPIVLEGHSCRFDQVEMAG